MLIYRMQQKCHPMNYDSQKNWQYPIEFQTVLIDANLQIVFGFVTKRYYWNPVK